MSSVPPSIDRTAGSTGSGKYFPIPTLPSFGSSELAPSFQALASHPKYRAAMQPYEEVHFDRYKKSLDLLRSWEHIAERYTAINVEDDLEIDVVTGDTLHRGEKIELDEEESLELWGDEYSDEEDEEDDMLDDSRICQTGDAVLNRLKGSAFQSGEGDWDVLDFWGPDSEMQIQAEALPDISSLPVKLVSRKDQAELDDFLRDEAGRRRQEKLDCDQLGLIADSDDHVEDAVDVRDDQVGSSSIVVRCAGGAITLNQHPDESPRKKRRVGRPRLLRPVETSDHQTMHMHTTTSADVSIVPSSDEVDLCSDLLATTADPLRTPNSFRSVGTRARRGRRPKIASLTPRKFGELRETTMDQFTTAWIDQNLLRSEITTPYISRSSRVVKVPERWGAHVQWASIRRPRGSRPGSTLKGERGPLECCIDLPAPPVDWREYTRSIEFPENAVASTSLLPDCSGSELGMENSSSSHRQETESVCATVNLRSAWAEAAEVSPPFYDSEVPRPLLPVTSQPPETVEMASLADATELIVEPSEANEAVYLEEETDESRPPSVNLPGEAEPSPDSGSRASSLSVLSLPASLSQVDNGAYRDSSSSLSSAPNLFDAVDLAGQSRSRRPSVTAAYAVECRDAFDAGLLPGIVVAEAEAAPDVWYDMVEVLPTHPTGTYEDPVDDNTDRASTGTAGDTIHVRPRSLPVFQQQVTSPPPAQRLPPSPQFLKYELSEEDDPLSQNTMDDTLDELNLELSLHRRVMLPISVRLPQGSKGSAIDNPIWIDEGEDELGGWDLDGWS